MNFRLLFAYLNDKTNAIKRKSVISKKNYNFTK